jgi:hypothetical protein
MQKKLAALAAIAALSAAVSSPAAAHDDPCPGPGGVVTASDFGGAAVEADRNGDNQVCFSFTGKSWKDNHVHNH